MNYNRRLNVNEDHLELINSPSYDGQSTLPNPPLSVLNDLIRMHSYGENDPTDPLVKHGLPFMVATGKVATNERELPPLDIYAASAHNYLKCGPDLKTGLTMPTKFFRGVTLKIPAIVSRNILVFPNRIIPFVMRNKPRAERFWNEVVAKHPKDEPMHIGLYTRTTTSGVAQAGALLRLVDYTFLRHIIKARFEVVQRVEEYNVELPPFRNDTDDFCFIDSFDVKTMVEQPFDFNGNLNLHCWGGHFRNLTAQKLIPAIHFYFFNVLKLSEEHVRKLAVLRDLVTASYHFGEFLLLTMEEKIRAYTSCSVEGRIAYLLKLKCFYETTMCTGCNVKFNPLDRIRIVNAAGIAPLYVNPDGHFYNGVAVDLVTEQSVHTENSYFIDYNWGFLTCRCFMFRGWSFHSENVYPDKFSLIVTNGTKIVRTPDH